MLELVEGPTLADRISKGPIPVDEALPIAKQIAEALEAAPTQSVGLTAIGTILGTLQHMAPEQLAGEEADVRSDVFALGTVIYEMVSGRKAFEGKSQATLAGAILHVDPPSLSSLQPMTSPTLDHLVKTCLAKEPDDRCQTAGEVERQLKWIVEGGSQPSTAASVASASQGATRRQVMPSVVAALVAGVVISAGVWVLKPQAPPPPRPLARFAITPPAPEWLGISNTALDLTISPLGTHIVSRGTTANGGLVVRALDQLEATLRPELGTLVSPFMSPDGASVGFASLSGGNLSLQRVSVFGGPAVTICGVPGGVAGIGASWGADDTIIFGTTSQPSGLWRVSAGGGEPEELTTPNAELDEVNHHWPEILPGGRAVLFTIMPAGPIENAQIAVLDLETGVQTVLVSGGSNPRYAPTGHIVYGVGGTLRAVGFDLDRLEVTTNPLPVLDGVITKGSGAANFSFSRDGTLVYVPGSGSDGGGGPQRTLVWVDREGREEPLALPPGGYQRVRVSPDGTRLAVQVSGPEGIDVWTSDLARGTLSILTPDPATDQNPLWTLDGERVVFSSDREPQGLFWKAADGRGPVEPLLTAADAQAGQLNPVDWSPDGNELIFNYFSTDTGGRDTAVLSMAGERTWQPLLNSVASESDAALSPDGRWIAYRSDETGQNEVYVERFPDLGNKAQISTGGGRLPVWSSDGSELFYRDPSGARMLVVQINTEPTLSVGTATVVFEGTYLRAGGRLYDLAPDGRFLMIKPGGAATEDGASALPQILVVEGWFEELKRLVPTP